LQATILNTFRHLNETYSITIIIVTHDINVSQHVDRVVSIRDGKTSTERIRHSNLRSDQSRPEDGEEEGNNNHEGVYHEYVVLDSAGRLQIPPEYREKLNIGDRVELDINEEGILIRPVLGRGLELTEFQNRNKEQQLKGERKENDRSLPSLLRWFSRILSRGRRA
jgi:putative ABC transport system ATP-binding protein